MFGSYQINPTAKLNVISDDMFQFRFPNANHITINHKYKYFENIINNKGSYPENHWLDLISKSGFPEEEAVAVFNTLIEIGVLVDGERQIGDLLGALLAHEDVSTNFARKEFRLPAFDSVGVYGEGAIADCVRSILDDSPMRHDPLGEGFRLVVADEEDLPLLSALWREAKGAKFAASLWSDGVSFRFGPLWVPGESACFECFLDRTRASSQYPAEFEAYRKSAALGTVFPRFSQGQMGLLHFVVERYFRLLSEGFFNVIEPGTIENWNFFVGDRQVQRVLRNPYCVHCSVGSMSSRAVRDLI